MATPAQEQHSNTTNGPEGGVSDARLAELVERLRADSIPTGLPDDMPTQEDLEAQRAHEAGQSDNERKTELQEKLKTQRAELARIAARRGGRAYSRKSGAINEEYENNLALHNETFRELTRLEHPDWELTGQETVEEANDKVAKATQHYIEHLADLRNATTEELQGTRIGKIVKFMNSGGRLKKFMKYAAVGVAAGAAGALTGGLAGGLVAGGVLMGGRFVRGAMRAEGTRTVGEGVGWRGKKNKAAHDSTIFENAFKLNGGKLDLAEAGAAAMATIFNKDIKDQQSQRRRSLGWGAFSVAAGAGVGYLAGMATDRLNLGSAQANAAPAAGQENGPTPGSAAHANIADRQSVTDFNTMMDKWIYKPEENPFFAPDKIGAHDLGAPLRADAALDAGKPAGWHDLTQNRWPNSPEQFASICAALGVDGMPDETGAINGLSERFKLDPMVYEDKHNAVMGILNAETTKIEGPIPIQSTISSEYGQDMGNGNMDLFRDDYVDNANKGTKMIITFYDEATGAYRTIELRCECGGQRMVEHPMPVYEPEPEYYAPQGGGYVPQGGGSPEYVAPQEQPQYSEPAREPDQPQGGGTPPTVTPPVVTPPTVTPPTTPPPATLNPKASPDAPQANPDVADFGKNLLGELFGNSENKPYNSAPSTYNPPSPSTSNETVPGSGSKLDSPKPAPAAPNVTPPSGMSGMVNE